MRVPAASARPNGWVISVHLTETCGEEDAVHLIMQAEITPATEQDVEETMPLLDDVQARDLVPEVRLVESGYVSGDVLAKHAALGIELVGPLKQEGGWQHETGYGVGAFQVDWQQQQVRCRKATPLAELVSRTTQPRRGGDPRELFRCDLPGLSGQSTLYQAGEAQGQDLNPFSSAHP
jgi:hypothetical protein